MGQRGRSSGDRRGLGPSNGLVSVTGQEYAGGIVGNGDPPVSLGKGKDNVDNRGTLYLLRRAVRFPSSNV